MGIHNVAGGAGAGTQHCTICSDVTSRTCGGWRHGDGDTVTLLDGDMEMATQLDGDMDVVTQ